MSRRVLVLCLSEASPELAQGWMAAGRLPDMAALAREGAVAGTVYGPPCLMTPQLWATISTGRSAGHHGVFDYWQRGDDGRFAAVDGSYLQEPRVWERLAAAGLRSCVVNVPVTYPPRPIDGIVIAGQDALGAHRSIAQPPEVYDDLVRRFGPYRLKEVFPGGRPRGDYLDLMQSSIAWQAEVLEHLLAREPWPLFVGYLSATAMAQHYFWADMARADPEDPFSSLIERTYGWVDEAIGRLRAAAGPDATTIVLSECGAGPLRSGVQVNTLLARAGLLHYRAANGAAPAGGRRRAAVARFRQAGQRYLPQRLYYAAGRLPVRSWIQGYLAGSDVDWGRTQVFYRGKGEGNLYVNLAGRYAHGSVAPADYEAVREAAIERLRDTVDPATGRRAIAAIHRREELFEGPRAGGAPDLVIEWEGSEYMPTEQDRQKDEVFVERWREFMAWPTSGSHRPRGLLLAAGPGIRPGACAGDVGLLDIAPTLLHLLGQEVPAELEGRPAAALLS